MNPDKILITTLLTCLMLSYFSLTTTLLCVLLYFYFTRNHDVWRDLGVNGPTPLPFLGNVLEQFYKTGHQVESERYKKYGRLYGYFVNNTPVLVIGKPEMVKNIMVKNWTTFSYRNIEAFKGNITGKMILFQGGDEWKRVRSIVGTSFTSPKIKKMFSLIDDCVVGVENNLEKHSQTNEDINLIKLFGAYSMDVIATVAFGTKTDSHNDPNDPFLMNAKDFFVTKYKKLIPVIFTPRFLLDLIDFNFLNEEMVEFFATISKKLMAERRNSKNKYHDFFQLMMDAERNDATVANDFKDINQAHFKIETNEEIEENAKRMTNIIAKERKLSEEEILAQSVLFFAAGYDTTASTLTNTAHLLAVNPEIQEKLYAEIKENFDTFGEIDYDSLIELKYLHAVISETLRLYPPLINTDRSSPSTYKFENTGITIPKNTLIKIPIYAIHHDEAFHPEPEKFKPERFLPENIDKILPYTYLPFGAGPRNCIGMRLALTEAKLVIAKLLINYRFVKSVNTDNPIRFTTYNLMPLVHSYPVYIKVEKRI